MVAFSPTAATWKDPVAIDTAGEVGWTAVAVTAGADVPAAGGDWVAQPAASTRRIRPAMSVMDRMAIDEKREAIGLWIGPGERGARSLSIGAPDGLQPRAADEQLRGR